MNLLANPSIGRAFRAALRRLNDWYVAPAGGDSRPSFLDVDEVAPGLRAALEPAYPAIRREALSLLPELDRIPAYDEVDPGQACAASVTPGRWRVYYFYAMGLWARANRERCPVTAAALDAVPDLFHAHFSVLDPGKSIPAHRGPYSGYLRYHLGLKVPATDTPRLLVAGEERTWGEGEGVLFDDRHYHEVINDSTESRLVLIVDILRPMPWPQAIVNRALVPVIRRLYGESVMRRVDRAGQPPSVDEASTSG